MKAAPAENLIDFPAAEESASGIQAESTDARSAVDLREQIDASIGEDLTHVRQLLDRQLQSPHAYMGTVLRHAGQYRGKQIRPILLLLCQKAAGGLTDRTTRVLAAVVELIHTATLVHDDILDNAARRRSLPTINQQWNTETGVLLGDFLFSRAFRLAASTGDAPACEFIGRATDLTCAGELHQIAAGQERSQSERDYFRIIRGKTGQLFGLSCCLGARSAQAPLALQRQLQIAGTELGMAFQIADDVLDLTGHEDQTGKDSGNDLVNRRLTLPVLRALHTAAPDERRQIEQMLTSDNPNSQDRLRRSSAIRQGIQSARQTAGRLVQNCVRRLNRLPESNERNLLVGICEFAIRRQT